MDKKVLEALGTMYLRLVTSDPNNTVCWAEKMSIIFDALNKDEWRPINTAPKDGRIIDLLCDFVDLKWAMPNLHENVKWDVENNCWLIWGNKEWSAWSFLDNAAKYWREQPNKYCRSITNGEINVL